MARARTYARCPHCESRYSGPGDETHAEGCPRPLERQLDALYRQHVSNGCPHCDGTVRINAGDLHECDTCHAQWVAAWTRGADAIKQAKLRFRVHGESILVIELPERGAGDFPRYRKLRELEGQVEKTRAAFKRS